MRDAQDCYGAVSDSAGTSLDYATDSVRSVPCHDGLESHFGVQSDLERYVLVTRSVLLEADYAPEMQALVVNEEPCVWGAPDYWSAWHDSA